MLDMKMLSPVKFINKKRRLHFACKDESGRPLFSSLSFQEPSAYLGKKSFVWTQEEKKFYPPTPSFSAEAAVMRVIYFILKGVYFLNVELKTSCFCKIVISCNSLPEYCQYGRNILEKKKNFEHRGRRSFIESQYSLKCCSFLQDPILTQVLLIRKYALPCLCSSAAHYQYAVPCLCSCAAHSLFWGGMEGLVWLGAFNNYVDKMRGERVKKCLFLSTLRV